MSGELEAAGAMATAGLAAGAIEGREAHEAGEGACLNCGAKLEGPYCAQCGQPAHAHRSLGHMFEEFLHGIVHFDTKAWRTLPMLFFRPGTLTRNYVYGKRARYISPLALFLFTIFLMFFVFAFMGRGPGLNVTTSATRAEAVADLNASRAALAAAEAELAEANSDATPEEAITALQTAVDLARQEVERDEALLAGVDAALARAARGEDQPEGVQVIERGEGLVVVQPFENSGSNWQSIVRQLADEEDFGVEGWGAFNTKLRSTMRNPDLAIYKIQQTAYKFSFLLVPISLPFIALLFLWKRGVTLYDHTVFALYSLSFASILFVIIALTGGISWLSWFTPASVLLGIPVHTYFHFKGAYALGWWSALWRTGLMLVFANIALLLFLLAIVIVGFAG